MSQTLTYDRNSVAAARNESCSRQAVRPSLRSRFLGLFQRNNERLKTIRELHALSDQMLRDIGVERDDIEASVDALLERSNGELGRNRR